MSLCNTFFLCKMTSESSEHSHESVLVSSTKHILMLPILRKLLIFYLENESQKAEKYLENKHWTVLNSCLSFHALLILKAILKLNMIYSKRRTFKLSELTFFSFIKMPLVPYQNHLFSFVILSIVSISVCLSLSLPLCLSW